MENKLEQLWNSLIKRGRVPFGDEKIHSFEIIYVTGKIWNIIAKRGRGQVNTHYSIRELVSKESGLWQFVCENGMVDDGVEYKGYALVDVDGGAIAKYETGCRYLYSNIEPEFYIIESSLKDESELESFILDNIKV